MGAGTVTLLPGFEYDPAGQQTLLINNEGCDAVD